MDRLSETLGLSLAGFMLSMTTLLALRQKGVLSIQETNEVIEQSLLGLETHQMSADPAARPSVEFARLRLEELRHALSD